MTAPKRKLTPTAKPGKGEYLAYWEDDGEFAWYASLDDVEEDLTIYVDEGMTNRQTLTDRVRVFKVEAELFPQVRSMFDWNTVERG